MRYNAHAQKKRGNRKRFSFKSEAENRPDIPLLIITALLIIFGVIMLSSATSIISFDLTNSSYALVKQQVLHGILPGIVLFVVAYNVPYPWYEKYTGILFASLIALLVIVFIPTISDPHNGVRGWVNIFSITFQPSEIAKLFFIIWLAAWLSSRQSKMHSFKKSAVPFIISILIICGLLALQPDIGTMMLFAGTGFFLFIAANARLSHIIIIAFGGLLAASSVIAAAPYRLARVLTLWNPGDDIQGTGYQVYQALLALGSGYWTGVGIGQSRQKLYFLPEVASDSIFAVIGEELGFLIASLFIVGYLILLIRGFKIAKGAPSVFGSLIVLGVMAMIGLQAITNIGSMVGLLPLTGIPLPFVSLGGTNLAILLAAIGIVANVSKYSQSKHA